MESPAVHFHPIRGDYHEVVADSCDIPTDVIGNPLQLISDSF